MSKTKNPEFRNPERYLECRTGRTALIFSQEKAERRAIDRSLEGLADVRTICDVPSGPGRLFRYWSEHDFRVHAVDVSAPMVEAAEKTHTEFGLAGSVGSGDAFQIADALPETPDLIACVRFAYYFEADRRVELLRSLAASTRRYVLVQYKTSETLKGQINRVRAQERRARPRKKHMNKELISYSRIVDELLEAGLAPLRIEPVGEFSDRVFVLAEKPEADPEVRQGVERLGIHIKRPWRINLPVLALVLFGLLYWFSFSGRSFWIESEAYYALGARSVLEGESLMPRIYNDVFAEEPPLMFWWIAGVSAAWGEVTEWTAWLASLLPSMGLLAAVFLIGRRWFGRWAGLLAMIVLGTSYGFWQNALVVHPAMLATLLLTMAWGAMFQLMEGRFKRSRWLLLWGGVGLTMLTAAGLTVAGLTAAVAVSFALAMRCDNRPFWRTLRQLRPVSGIALALAPFGAWLAAVYTRFGPESLRTIVLDPYMMRIMNHFDQEISQAEVFDQFPVSLLPWSLLLPFVAYSLFRLWRREPGGLAPGHRFALCALGVIFAGYALSSHKPDAFLLPFMPWAALLIGEFAWVQLCKSVPVEDVDIVCGREFGGRLLGLRFGRLVTAGGIFALLGISVYGAVAAGILEPSRSAKPLARAVNSAVDEDDQLVIVDHEDYRIMFYLNESFATADDGRRSLARLTTLMQSGREIDLLVQGEDLKDFVRTTAEIPLFVEGSLVFRDTTYYILTNESTPGATSLLEMAIRNPSGMSYHPGRDSLFVVGDRGDIAEVDRKGKVLRQRWIGGDLEGIAVDPGNGMLYVADESRREILMVDPALMEVAARYEIRGAKGAGYRNSETGKGIEGLCFPGTGETGVLYGVQQEDPSLLVEFRLEPPHKGSQGRAVVVRSVALKNKELREMALSSDRQRMLVYDEDRHSLFEVSPDGAIGRQTRIPGEALQAMAFVPDGSLFVCDEDGALRIYQPEALRDLMGATPS